MSGEQNRSEWCSFAMYKGAMEQKEKIVGVLTIT